MSAHGIRLGTETVRRELDAAAQAARQVEHKGVGILVLATADVPATISLESASSAVQVHTSPVPKGP